MQCCVLCSVSIFLVVALSCSVKQPELESGAWVVLRKRGVYRSAWVLVWELQQGFSEQYLWGFSPFCELHGSSAAAQAGSSLNVGLTDALSDRAEFNVTAWLNPT